VCKYRKKLLKQGIETNIKSIIIDIESNSNFEIIEMETDIDHIHFSKRVIASQPFHFTRMIQYIPRVSISAIVNRIKSITTKRIWNLHQNYLQKHFSQKLFAIAKSLFASFGKKKLFGLMAISYVVSEKLVLKLLGTISKIKAKAL
jgi:REP element-mobilizing transposase RayT